MKPLFIESIMDESAIYEKKANTKNQYYWKSGCKIFPNRMSISFERLLTHPRRWGRATMNPIGEVDGQFKIIEKSWLKQNKPFKLHSLIYKDKSHPLLAGYAIIAISETNGETTKEIGTMIFHKKSDNEIEIFFCKGITDSSPNDLESFLEIVNGKIR